jgi:hypothetical protein
MVVCWQEVARAFPDVKTKFGRRVIAAWVAPADNLRVRAKPGESIGHLSFVRALAQPSTNQS